VEQDRSSQTALHLGQSCSGQASLGHKILQAFSPQEVVQLEDLGFSQMFLQTGGSQIGSQIAGLKITFARRIVAFPYTLRVTLKLKKQKKYRGGEFRLQDRLHFYSIYH